MPSDKTKCSILSSKEGAESSVLHPWGEENPYLKYFKLTITKIIPTLILDYVLFMILTYINLGEKTSCTFLHAQHDTVMHVTMYFRKWKVSYPAHTHF